MKSQRYEDPDKKSNEEVQLLDLWQTEDDFECRQRLTEIERGFRLKHNQQDEVEREMRMRRNRHKLPKVTSRPVNEMQEVISERRLEVRKHAMSFKEKSRFAKSYEEELDQTRNEYETELEQMVFNRERLRRQISDARQNLTNLAIDLEHQKELAVKQEAREKKAKEEKTLTLSDYFYRRSTIQQNLEHKILDYKNLKDELNTNIADKSQEIADLDARVHQIKENLKLVKRTQVNHYLGLLKEGVDTRNDGLEWIIKALWRLNFQLKRPMFPSFLDDEAVANLLEFAKMSCEYDDMQAEFEREVARSRQTKRSPDRWNGVKDRLKQLKSNIKTKKKNVKVNRTARTTDIRWEDIDTEVIPTSLSRELMIDNTASLEKQMLSCRQMIDEAKDKEIDRLTHACFMNNYEMKYGTQMKTLLSCIVGIDSIDRYLACINREQKVLTAKLLKSKTFKFAKNPIDMKKTT